MQSFDRNSLIKRISFESDVAFQQEEFFYLLGFKEGDCINYEHIMKAVECFSRKNKFLTIKIMIDSNDKNERSLHFVFESEWTFRKVKIHALYQGKHFFSQLYSMQRGEFFDQSKHEHAIHHIKNFLLEDGYFDHAIASHCEYDNAFKEVIVHLYIKKGRRFTFGNNSINIMADEEDNDKTNIQLFVHKKLLQNLLNCSYSKELLNEQTQLLKNYLAKKGFLHAIIEIKEKLNYENFTVALEWDITLYKKKEIVFFGHRFFSKKQLLDTILVFDQSIWLIPASLLAEEIIRAYKSKGFLDVEVIIQEEKDRSFFIIKEGARVAITDIEIRSNEHLDMQTIKKHCFKKLLKNYYYDLQLYEEGINNITKLYYEQGYFNFTVISYDFILTDERNEYILVINVDADQRTYISKVAIEEYPELEQTEIFQKINDFQGSVPFNVQLLEEQRSYLIKHFQSLGYTRPHIKPYIPSVKDENNICIRWNIDPGEKIYFGKTIVLGAVSFPFPAIASLLTYQEGEVWDQTKIQQSFRALKNLGIFETIHFLPHYKDTEENKSVLLKLDLDDRYEIRARAGLELQHIRKYQTFSGLTYKLGNTAIIKNPSNCADQLRFDCDFTRSHREVVARYKRPWFTTHPFFTTAQVYSIVYDQPGFIGSTNDLYTLVQNGFLFGIEKKTSSIDIVWNNGFEWMKLHIDDDEERFSFAHAINFEPRFIDKMIPFFFTESTFMVERVDNPLNPTRGGIGLLSLKGMIPLLSQYKDSLFFKILAEQSLFIPLKEVVGAIRLRCGHIFYREFSGIMPSERFYLGGSHSLRGYEADLAPPLGVFLDDDGQDHIVPRGGRTMVNANFELRFPLWKKLGGVIFQDIGALSGTFFADFKKQDMLAASGFGLRIFTPLGPLRFDMGWRWHKQLAIERSFAWFLTFGQAF